MTHDDHAPESAADPFIASQVQPEMREVICPWCRGTARLTDRCGYCAGSGHVTVEQ